MKNTINLLILFLLVTWIPFYGSSQISLNPQNDENQDTAILIQIDSLGLYYRVPFKRAQTIAWKAGFFQQFLQCRDEISGITSQYLIATQKLDSLNKQISNIVVNNDYLVQKSVYDDKEKQDLKKQVKNSKLWHWVKDIAIGGLLAFSISKL